MAIPSGTTARQVAGLSRLTLAVVLAVGLLVLWWPGYRTWGALGAGLLLVWTLWLCRQLIEGVHTVAGNPIYLVLLAPAVVLAGHFGGSGLGREHQAAWAMAGAMDLSMLEHLALLALGMMLVQDGLSDQAKRAVLPAVCGGAMMAGPASVALAGHGGPIAGPLALVSLAGVAVWLTPFWTAGHSTAAPGPRWLGNRKVRLLWVGVAVIVGTAVAMWRPAEALLAVCAAGSMLVLCGLVFPGRRAVMLLAGLVASGVGGRLAWGSLLEKMPSPVGLFGRGEEAFGALSATDSGLEVLSVTVGWVGLVGSMACFGLGLVWLIIQARLDGSDRAMTAALWATASLLAGGALLVCGGLFLPAVTLATALIWGLLPAGLGAKLRYRPGWALVVLVVMMMGLLGLSRKAGLLAWASRSFGRGDTTLHCLTGFFLAMVLVWMFGQRRLWAGLVGIAAAGLLGGAAEVLQAVASQRSVELSDWMAHLLGAAGALPLYLLCMGARWAESDKVLPVREGLARYGRLE